MDLESHVNLLESLKLEYDQADRARNEMGECILKVTKQLCEFLNKNCCDFFTDKDTLENASFSPGLGRGSICLELESIDYHLTLPVKLIEDGLNELEQEYPAFKDINFSASLYCDGTEYNWGVD